MAGIAAAALALATVVAGVEPASSLPEAIELVWRAPPECPGRATVEGYIVAGVEGLGGERRTVSAQALVEAVLTKNEQGYRLDLQLSIDGVVLQRQIHADDCSLLARATGLIVAVSVDAALPPEAVNEAMRERAEGVQREDAGTQTSALSPDDPAASAVVELPDKVDEPPTAGSREADLQPRSATSRLQRLELGAALRISGGLQAGILPGIGGGLDVSMAALGKWWRVEGHGGRLFSRTKRFDGEGPVGANFAAWSGGARGCIVPPVGRWEFPVCFGVELAQIHAEGFGAPMEFEVRTLWAGAVVSGGALWFPTRWMGLFGGLQGIAALNRPAYSGPRRPLLYRSAPVAIRAVAGLEFRLGGPDRI